MQIILNEETVNTMGLDIDTPEKPLFTKSKWGGRDQYTIPETLYNRMRYGRTKGSKWSDFVEDETLKSEIQKTLYKNGECVVSCGSTGISAIIRHNKTPRLNESEFVDIIDFDHSLLVEEFLFEDIKDNEEFLNDAYDSSYDYALDELGLDEDEAMLSASIVRAFLHLYATDGLNDKLSLENNIEYVMNNLSYIDNEVEIGYMGNKVGAKLAAMEFITVYTDVMDTDDEVDSD